MEPYYSHVIMAMYRSLKDTRSFESFTMVLGAPNTLTAMNFSKTIIFISTSLKRHSQCRTYIAMSC